MPKVVYGQSALAAGDTQRVLGVRYPGHGRRAATCSLGLGVVYEAWIRVIVDSYALDMSSLA